MVERLKAGWGGVISVVAWLGASRGRSAAAALAVFATVLAGAAYLIELQVQREQERTRAAVASIANAEAAALAVHVEGAVSATYSLAALVRQSDYQVNPAAFAGFARALLRVQPGISALQYAPGGVIRHIEPQEGNEAALGIDLFAHSFHGPIARRIVEARELTLVGPFELAQGGLGIVARLPIFYARDTGDRFWGFAQVLIVLPDMLAGTRLPQLGTEGYAWRLRLDRNADPFAGNGSPIIEPVAVKVALPTTSWLLEMAPAGGWHASTRTRPIGWLAALLFAALAAAFAHAVVRQPARLMQEVDRRTADLARATERLDLAIAAADLGLWDWRLADDRVEFNDRWRRIVGAATMGDLPQHLAEWWPRVHPDDQEAVRAAAKRQLTGESPYFEVEYRLRDWQDGWRWIRSRGRVVERDAEGQALRAAGTNRDITDEKARDEQLQLKSTALEVAANAVVITAPDGAIEWINPAFTDFTGYSADEVIGKNPRILKSGVHDEAIYRELWETIAAGRVWTGEMVNRRKDGTMYREIQTITPVRDADGVIRHFLTIKRDVTERRAAEQALRERERLLDAFFSQSLDGCFFMLMEEPLDLSDGIGDDVLATFLDRQHVTRVNEAMLGQYRASEPDFVGRRLADFFAHDRPAGLKVAHDLLSDGRLHVETDERRFDGTPIRVEGDYALLRDEADRVLGHFGVQRDVTERHALQEELGRLATTDLLTGLPNRRHLMERLGQEFARFERTGADSALLMLDLDHFKRVNDTHGHAAGDTVLQMFGHALQSSLRQTDIAGRLGGEEFAVFLHGTGPAGARVFAERLRRRIEAARVAVGGVELGVTVSIGGTLFDAGDAGAEAALARADAALYQSKREGRNRVTIA